MAKELMNEAIVMFDVEANSAEEVIRLIADAMDKDDRLIDKEGYVADVLARGKLKHSSRFLSCYTSFKVSTC